MTPMTPEFRKAVEDTIAWLESNPADHTRGSFARDRYNQTVSLRSDLAVAWCAIGGLIKRYDSSVFELPGETRNSIVAANDLHGPVAAARELRKLLEGEQPHEMENMK